jgi:HPt (histidine-containing phosphotransfer) domain-containing protein
MSGEFNERMERLRQRFRQRSGGDRAALEAALERQDTVEMKRLAHSLSGAAGIFGYPVISERAAALEAALDRNEAPEDAAKSLLCELTGLINHHSAGSS